MSKDKIQENDALFCKRNKVGGQAVLEGVMMKSANTVCVAVRAPEGNIVKDTTEFNSVRKKHKILNIPLLRGVVNFFEMMKLSFKTLSVSGELLGQDMEESKFEKWLQKKFGKSIMSVVMPISIILGLALAVGLFFLLPSGGTGLIERLTGTALPSYVKTLIEGALKILIFISYLLLVSLMPDIKRTFMYHGSEHKSIACYEAGLELNVENVKTQTRFHRRCGTSFMFVMLILGIIIGMLIPWDWANVDNRFLSILIRVGLKLVLLPFTVGIGYEFLMFSAKHDNWFIRALIAPGLWFQRITTREPDDSMIEVAIAALKGALPDEFNEEGELIEKSEEEQQASDAEAEKVVI